MATFLAVRATRGVKSQYLIALLTLAALFSALASSAMLWHTAEAFADHKPGLWGEPVWYLLLILAGAILLVSLLLNGTIWILGGDKKAYKRHTALLIGLATIRGLFYSAVLPPWQSPDEHAHFEYAALMGELKRVPTLGDLSPELQQRITRSMFEYDFWRLIKRQPVSSPPAGFIIQSGINREPADHLVDNRYLYYPQVGDDPPLYYIVPGILYTLLTQADAALQLYVMRLATVSMWVGLIGVVIWGTRCLFHDDPLITVGTPTLLAFHPMLTHMGSVLNNDMLAALLTTLLLVVLVETMRVGIDWRRGLLIAGLSIAEIVTKKNGFWTVILVISVWLIWGARRWRWMRGVIVGAGILTAGCLVLFFIPTSRAREWSPAVLPWEPTATRAAAIDGKYALRVAGDIVRENRLTQHISPQTTLDLRGRMICLTAKVYAESSMGVGALAIMDLDKPGQGTRVDFQASSTWRSVVLQWTVPTDAIHLQVALVASPQTVIYFDQIALVDLSQPDVPLKGLHNTSGEQRASVGEIFALQLGKRLGLERALQRLFRLWKDNIRRLLQDPWPIRLAFESFWGNFGAALVVPLPPLAYRILRYACALSLLGIGIYIYRTITGRENTHNKWQKLSLCVLASALLLMMFQTFAPLIAMYGVWAPQGRYLFPTIWPIGIFLTLGWAQLTTRRGQLSTLTVLTLGMITLDYTAIRLLANYFYAI